MLETIVFIAFVLVFFLAAIILDHERLKWRQREEDEEREAKINAELDIAEAPFRIYDEPPFLNGGRRV